MFQFESAWYDRHIWFDHLIDSRTKIKSFIKPSISSESPGTSGSSSCVVFKHPLHTSRSNGRGLCFRPRTFRIPEGHKDKAICWGPTGCVWCLCGTSSPGSSTSDMCAASAASDGAIASIGSKSAMLKQSNSQSTGFQPRADAHVILEMISNWHLVVVQSSRKQMSKKRWAPLGRQTAKFPNVQLT